MHHMNKTDDQIHTLNCRDCTVSRKFNYDMKELQMCGTISKQGRTVNQSLLYGCENDALTVSAATAGFTKNEDVNEELSTESGHTQQQMKCNGRIDTFPNTRPHKVPYVISRCQYGHH